MAKKKTDSAASLALIALSCILHVVIFRGKVDMNHSVIYRILSALLAVVIVLPIHELIHWISMRFFGRKDAIFLFSDRIAIALFIATASNSAGCCFDLLAVLRKK